MSYLGRGLDNISNVEKLDNITFNGGTTYALTKSSAAFTPAGSNNILISIDGVVQQGNFSVSGSNIVFTFSPTSSNTCDFIMHYGTGLITTPADSTVSTAKIIDDAVTEAKIADASVDEARLKISNSPTNGYMLTAQSGNTGGLTWAEAPSGTLVKIADGNTTGASVSYVDVAQCFSSTYKIYKIFFYDVNTALDTALYMRWLTGSGSTEQAGNDYTYAISGFNSSNGGSNNGGQATYINLIGEDMRHDADEHFAMEGTLYNPAGTTLKKRFLFHTGGRRTGNYATVGIGSAEWNSTTAITGFRFLTNTGNIDSLYYVVYGVVI